MERDAPTGVHPVNAVIEDWGRLYGIVAGRDCARSVCPRFFRVRLDERSPLDLERLDVRCEQRRIDLQRPVEP